MIEKELFFEYNLNYLYIYDITIINNFDIIQIINDLIEYKQGIMKNNKRKDIIKFKLNDIPIEMTNILSYLIRDNIIPLKLKIKILEHNSNNIKIKVKSYILNNIINIITKIINITIFCDIINIDNNHSKVCIKYVIKSILPKDIIDKINNYIELKLNNNYIFKFDNYLKNIK